MTKQQDISSLLSEEGVERAQEYVSKNKNVFLYVLVGIAVIIGGIYYYINNSKKTELEARESLWQAEYYMGIDSFNLAINGNGQFMSLLDVVEEYGGTEAANIASYDLGVCYLKTGQFDLAVEYLEGASFDDIILQTMAIGTCADAHSELQQYDIAAKKYLKAANSNTNEFSTPYYLMKAGIHFEKLGDNSEALEAYQTIKDEYSKTSYATNIDKYIARVQ